MTRVEKLLKQFLERPESLRYSQIRGLLKRLGFVQEKTKGSHKNFSHPELKLIITIPVHHNDCINFYKRKLSKIIKNNLL